MALRNPTLHAIAELDSIADKISAGLKGGRPWTIDPRLSSKGSCEFMSNVELADHCMREIERFRCDEPSDDQYGVELFRRALKQRDPAAWEVVQQRFAEMIRGWLCTHLMRQTASYFDSDENYVALTFARFWQATAGNQRVEFTTIASILCYLRVSLNCTILDTLRTYLRPKEFVLPEPDCCEELYVEEQDDGAELWEAICSIIPDRRERRLAHLLFHCHLKPREIVRFCPGEFDGVTEVYRLKRNIFDRLLRSADYLRWRLASEPGTHA